MDNAAHRIYPHLGDSGSRRVAHSFSLSHGTSRHRIGSTTELKLCSRKRCTHDRQDWSEKKGLGNLISPTLQTWAKLFKSLDVSLYSSQYRAWAMPRRMTLGKDARLKFDVTESLSKRVVILWGLPRRRALINRSQDDRYILEQAIYKRVSKST